MPSLDADRIAPTVARLAVRTPTLPPATHTNMYLLGTGEALLVEPASPYPEEIERAVAWAETQRDAGVRLRAIVATHHHRDHIGGAAQLRQRLGIPLWAHGYTADRAAHVDVDRYLEEGQVIELDGPTPTRVTCVHTPGHAPGHLCLLDSGSGMLVAGDMVASAGTILVDPVDGDMVQYLASLARMGTLGATALLPAHGDPIAEVAAKLAHYRAHRLMREARVLDALRSHAGPATAAELVPVAYADADPRAWPLATLAAEAHLIKLDTDGVVERTPAGWRVVSG